MTGLVFFKNIYIYIFFFLHFVFSLVCNGNVQKLLGTVTFCLIFLYRWMSFVFHCVCECVEVCRQFMLYINGKHYSSMVFWMVKMLRIPWPLIPLHPNFHCCFLPFIVFCIFWLMSFALTFSLSATRRMKWFIEQLAMKVIKSPNYNFVICTDCFYTYTPIQTKQLTSFNSLLSCLVQSRYICTGKVSTCTMNHSSWAWFIGDPSRHHELHCYWIVYIVAMLFAEDQPRFSITKSKHHDVIEPFGHDLGTSLWCRIKIAHQEKNRRTLSWNSFTLCCWTMSATMLAQTETHVVGAWIRPTLDS